MDLIRLGWLPFFLVGCVGVGTLLWVLADLLTALRSRRWSRVQGVVKDLQFEEEHDAEFDSSSYRPVLAYEYVVGRQTYHGRRLQFGQSPLTTLSLSGTERERLASELPVGTRVTVYYNPKRPASATLRVGPTARHAALAALGVFLTGFAAVALL